MKNMFTGGLFSPAVGFGIKSGDNNQIINEAIILDKLNGDTKALVEFYSNLGSFGARDGILNESASISLKLNTITECNMAQMAATLATAKEANAEEYNTYVKAVMLMNECIEKMCSSYGNIAKERLDTQKVAVESNPRIADAIDKVESAR